MKRFLVTFDISVCEELEQTYEDLITTLKGYKAESYLEMTKTTWLLVTDKRKDSTGIRDDLMKVYKKHNTDGTVMVVDVTLAGYSCHFSDKNYSDSKAKFDWTEKWL